MSVAPWDSLLLFSLCSDAVWCCSSFFITRSGSLLCHTVSVGLCHRLCWLYTSAGGDRLCSCFSSRCGLSVSVGVDARSSQWFRLFRSVVSVTEPALFSACSLLVSSPLSFSFTLSTVMSECRLSVKLHLLAMDGS